MTVEFEPQANEVFVPIRGFENYLISNHGRVWNSKKKRFVGNVNRRKGYRQVSFKREGKQHTFQIHRLVMFHFGEPQTEDKPEIDHIDRDKQNNRIDNLRWVNKSENQKNKDKYKQQRNEYIEELPDSAVELEHYNGFEFDKYWFDYGSKRLIMRMRSGKLKFVNVNVNRGFMRLYDINGNGHTVCWKKFYQEMMSRIDEEGDDESDLEDSEELED